MSDQNEKADPITGEPVEEHPADNPERAPLTFEDIYPSMVGVEGKDTEGGPGRLPNITVKPNIGEHETMAGAAGGRENALENLLAEWDNHVRPMVEDATEQQISEWNRLRGQYAIYIRQQGSVYNFANEGEKILRPEKFIELRQEDSEERADLDRLYPSMRHLKPHDEFVE